MERNLNIEKKKALKQAFVVRIGRTKRSLAARGSVPLDNGAYFCPVGENEVDWCCS